MSSSRPPDVHPALADADAYLEPIIDGKRVIVCAGAGGVGKTTTSAAIGLAAAARGRRALVLTIDPARRLAEAMGIPEAARAPAAVPREILRSLGVPEKGSLHAWMLNPDVVFESMVRRLTQDETRVNEILQNRLYQHLSKMVSGMQEYTAAEALYTLATSGDYDLVVLDTPPSRNALEFLEAPNKLRMFLDPRIIGVFLPKKGAFWKAATDLIDTVFKRAFGEGFFKDLQSFLGAFSGMFGGMREHADHVRALLSSDEAAFLLVTSPEAGALAESAFFQKRIEELNLPFAGYILNRSWAYTRGFTSPDSLQIPPNASNSLLRGIAKLEALAEAERRRAARDRDLLARLRMETSAHAAIATPHVGGAIADLEGLATLAQNLVRFPSPI